MLIDRPQQNARAERKHRHILELARALRFQVGLPINFWGDCVLTAVYLINRLPTPLLKFKSPHEVLLKYQPDYQNLRIFGCLAFATNPATTTDKFTTGVFLAFFWGILLLKRGTNFIIFLPMNISFPEMFNSMRKFFLFIQLIKQTL